jgi:anti-anti-sigma regulatory factor
MVTSPVVVSIDEQRLALALEQAAKQMDSGVNEVTLDFTSVRRIDASHVRRMEDLARSEKGVKIVLRGVNVDVYKALKLLKLTNRFLFVS